MPKKIVQELRNATIFLTRKCPYSCRCCKIHCNDMAELNTEQWIEAMRILRLLKIEFNLIIGNEPWILGDDLLKIIHSHKIPYAMYSSCHPSIFGKKYEHFFANGLDSLACGVDSYCPEWSNKWTHTQAKSYYAIDAFRKTRQKFPNVDCQATCTVSAFNAHELINLCNFFSHELKMCIAYNFIHSDIDGKFDFFPSLKEMERQRLLLTDRFKFDLVRQAMDELFLRLHGRKDHRVFGLEDFLSVPMVYGVTGVTNTLWHCNGNPHGGPTIDADGTLRLCAYRKGDRVPEMTIFDLARKGAWDEWKTRMKDDAAGCPGCLWNCPRMYEYYNRDPEKARQVFIKHIVPTAGDGKGNKRIVEKA